MAFERAMPVRRRCAKRCLVYSSRRILRTLTLKELFMPDASWWGYRVRAEIAAPFLSGRGLEIGAGQFPHRLPDKASALYFDKRDAEGLSIHFGGSIPYEVRDISDISSHFPDGADFLIAHNVLEHCPDVIGTLIGWHSNVKNEGVVVLSVPEQRFTAGDSRRLVAPIRHLLEDYLFSRNGDSFESRQHIYDFCLNWDIARWTESWRSLERDEFASFLLDNAHRGGHDCHWHALPDQTWRRAVAAALAYGGRGATLLGAWTPESLGEYVPQGEVIYIYRMSKSASRVGFPEISGDLTAVAADAERALMVTRQALRQAPA